MNMDTITLKENINVWGFQVKSFPEGIGEAFDSLMTMIPDALDRAFYGISYMEGNSVRYYATVIENYPGEAEKYNCQRYIIEHGEYATITVKGWKNKTHTIKDVFGELYRKQCPDMSRPAIEWYKNDDEMLCMVRVTQPEQVAVSE
jgi:DNA gyrase inhibitor GyrI